MTHRHLIPPRVMLDAVRSFKQWSVVRIGRFVRKVDFWSLRNPRAQLSAAGWDAPGITRAQRRKRVADVVPVHTHVRDFTNMLFDWRGDSRKSFKVEGGPEALKPDVERAFLRHRGLDIPPIGVLHLQDLEDLLRAVAWGLMVHGEVALVADWHPATRRRRRDEELLQFRIVLPSALKRARLKDGSAGYEMRVPTLLPNSEWEVLRVDARDVFSARWPLLPRPEGKNPPRSPVDGVLDAFVDMWQLEQENLAILEAHAYPQYHSFWAARARWQNTSGRLTRVRDRRLLIQIGLYALVPDRQQTKYFDMCQALKYRERVAIVREYLVERVNMAVKRYLKVLGYEDGPHIALIGYRSSGDIRQALERFTRREVSAEEAMTATANQ